MGFFFFVVGCSLKVYRLKNLLCMYGDSCYEVVSGGISKIYCFNWVMKGVYF